MASNPHSDFTTHIRTLPTLSNLQLSPHAWAQRFWAPHCMSRHDPVVVLWDSGRLVAQ